MASKLFKISLRERSCNDIEFNPISVSQKIISTVYEVTNLQQQECCAFRISKFETPSNAKRHGDTSGEFRTALPICELSRDTAAFDVFLLLRYRTLDVYQGTALCSSSHIVGFRNHSNRRQSPTDSPYLECIVSIRKPLNWEGLQIFTHQLRPWRPRIMTAPDNRRWLVPHNR